MAPDGRRRGEAGRARPARHGGAGAKVPGISDLAAAADFYEKQVPGVLHAAADEMEGKSAVVPAPEAAPASLGAPQGGPSKPAAPVAAAALPGPLVDDHAALAGDFSGANQRDAVAAYRRADEVISRAHERPRAELDRLADAMGLSDVVRGHHERQLRAWRQTKEKHPTLAGDEPTHDEAWGDVMRAHVDHKMAQGGGASYFGLSKVGAAKRAADVGLLPASAVPAGPALPPPPSAAAGAAPKGTPAAAPAGPVRLDDHERAGEGHRRGRPVAR